MQFNPNQINFVFDVFRLIEVPWRVKMVNSLTHSAVENLASNTRADDVRDSNGRSQYGAFWARAPLLHGPDFHYRFTREIYKVWNVGQNEINTKKK